MKKKLLSALLAALLVLSMIPFAFAGTVAATEPGNVAYLTDGGDDETAELNSASAPYGTFKAAYSALCPAGGTIKIVGAYGTSEGTITGLSVHYGKITITGNDSSSYWQCSHPTANGATIKFGGEVEITNIRLYAPFQMYFVANHSRITMGEGIVCENTLGTALAQGSGSGKISVLGGTFNGNNFEDSWIVVKSGVYRTIAGGARPNTQLSADETHPMFGTAYIFFEGGTTNYIIATNWAEGASVKAAGGGAYVYVSGGIVNEMQMGGQNAEQFAFSDVITVYTGGWIKFFRSGQVSARTLVFYGGDISSDYANMELGNQYNTDNGNNDIFVNGDGQASKLRPVQVPMNIIPLRTGDDQVVYLGKAAGGPAVAARASGTEEAPTYSLAAAIALLTYSGGTIVLNANYTIANIESTGAYRFNEPYHAKPITITGATAATKLSGQTPVNNTRTKQITNSSSYTMPFGLDVYNLCGDTTFENITLDFQRTGSNIAANFHHLTIGAGVTTTNMIRLAGATVAQEKTILTPYTSGRYLPYSRWSDADTFITLEDGNTGTWWITAFARVDGQATLPEGFDLAYPGTAHVTINGGYVDALYPAPTNKRAATGANAVIAINGGTVNRLYDGGYDAGNGAVSDSIDITVGENATVKNYVNINNSNPETFDVKVNSTYSSYLIAKNTYTQANVTTDITADTYRDSIDTVLGFGLKDNGADGVKIRYGAKLKDYIVDDPDFTVKEFGVLIKNANNATSLECFDSDAQLTYQNKVAKKIAYKAGTEINYYAYDPANGNDVQFYTTLTGISEARYETEYVFRAYMVVTVNGVDQVVYGAESADSAYTIAQRLTSSNETAAKVIDAVENAGA